MIVDMELENSHHFHRVTQFGYLIAERKVQLKGTLAIGRMKLRPNREVTEETEDI